MIFMKIINFKFVDGTCTAIEISDEFAEVYEQIIKYEKKVYRKDTRRRTSIDAMKKYGREIVGLNADVEEAIESDELLCIEQERYEREERREENKQVRNWSILPSD